MVSQLKNTMSGVHILPFNPYSSDDGFSIIDYTAVNPELGSWDDITALGNEFTVMADLVINHCSRESLWFKNYERNKAPGRGYFINGLEFEDLSQVVRPRSMPLLTEIHAVDGVKQVWCTFGEDQVDLNYRNPDVLLRSFALSASMSNRVSISFVWMLLLFSGKNLAPVAYLPQTHELIKLLRLVIENLDPSAVIITETNVPNRENLSYFGNDNEAHLIYNFSLPPLLLYSILSGDCRHLKTWMTSMPPARSGRAYLNFIASHDGIGLRPAEGLLSPRELDGLIENIRESGGEISMRRTPQGDLTPYEANISLYSAMERPIGGEVDDFQMARFICAYDHARA